jgi:flagellin
LPITIFSNLPALRAQGELRKHTAGLTQSYERLSSGMRINRAKDDAAGLAIAERLRADTRMASVAIRNINDGLSLVSIYEGALNEITNILFRMSELAMQAKNGTLTEEQLSPLNAEFVALGSEINRIKSTTAFNDINPFNSGTIWIQAMSKDRDTQIPILLSGVTETDSVVETSDVKYVAQGAIKEAMNQIGEVRAYNASRLEFASNHMTMLRENFSAADSQIRDTDVAAEAAELVKQQILQQAAAAILAQANIQPQFALRLLPSVVDDG